MDTTEELCFLTQTQSLINNRIRRLNLSNKLKYFLNDIEDSIFIIDSLEKKYRSGISFNLIDFMYIQECWKKISKNIKINIEITNGWGGGFDEVAGFQPSSIKTIAHFYNIEELNTFIKNYDSWEYKGNKGSTFKINISL